jgi:tetratricopeptide (TPR) repeat protein
MAHLYEDAPSRHRPAPAIESNGHIGNGSAVNGTLKDVPDGVRVPTAGTRPAPAAEPARRRWGAAADRAMTLGLKGIVVAGVTLTLYLAGSYVLANRGALRVVSFQVSPTLKDAGFNEGMLALQLGQMLNDVQAGARDGLEEDADFYVASDSPPQITIPGAGLSVPSLVSFLQIGPLAERQVRGTLVESDGEFRVLLELRGFRLRTRTIVSQPYPEEEQAMLEAAERLLGLLHPNVRAAYLFRRYPDRAAQAIRDALAESTRRATAEGTTRSRLWARLTGRMWETDRAAEEATSYRIWGVLLRDAGDYAGAREKLEKARAIWRQDIVTTPPHRPTATAYVELGHTAQLQHQWAEARAAYREAISFDPTWAAPHRYLADVLRADEHQRDLEAAVVEYRTALDLEPLAPEAMSGLGLALEALGDRLAAEKQYTEATRLVAPPASAALLAYGRLADILVNRGRKEDRNGHRELACPLYARALELDRIFGPSFAATLVHERCA